MSTLPRKVPRWLRRRPPPLSINQILAWADEQHARTGQWPKSTDIHVACNLNEKWRNIDQALRDGHRGLPGRDSLPRLLARERGVRNQGDLPDLSVAQILAWADAQHDRTGQWPNTFGNSGPVLDVPGESWTTIDHWLREGGRGLSGGSSIARLLAQERGIRNLGDLPDLTAAQVRAWARQHHKATGEWPSYYSGPIAGAPGETWMSVERALREGSRGFPGGDTLAQLLARDLGVRNKAGTPRLTVGQILAWADAHRQRSGQWPRVVSGEIPEAPEETWVRVDTALREGLRGLKGGTSLPRLLAERRGARNKAETPPLSIRQILTWADAHFQRTGRWPNQTSGAVLDAPGETWGAIHRALSSGYRGFPRGDSLYQLLRRERGIPRSGPDGG